MAPSSSSGSSKDLEGSTYGMLGVVLVDELNESQGIVLAGLFPQLLVSYWNSW